MVKGNMDEDTEYVKLPLEDRCVHKLWKARVHGYEEAAKLFQQIDDEKSSEWNKYLGLIKKFVADTNVCAQEKGLIAALAYIENVRTAGRTVGEVMSVVVNKCLGSPKVKIKDLGVQISLMYIEVEKQDVVLEELIKGSEHKNPKIAAACIATVTQALREFGGKVINLKNILKKVPTLLEDRDKNVRDETKTLMIEMYRWIGPPLRNQLANLKPIQVQELNSEFDKIENSKAIPTRLLRSQQAKKAQAADQIGVEDEGEDEADGDDQPDVDPYDLLTAVDILSKLPKDFYEKLEDKKWKERKESLDCLEQLLQNAQKLENGDYGDLIRALKKVIVKDNNVILVGIGAKCMALLGSSLKKRFQSYAGNLLLPLLEKFKEKKQNVVLPLRDAVDAVYESLTLEHIREDVITAMENKNPSVQAETVAFLARCFTKCTPMILNKKLLKAFTAALIKTLNESDPTVRENSAEAIGTAYKVVGENAINPFLTDVDNIRLGKIKEAAEKAVIIAKVPKESKKKAVASEPSGTQKVKAGSVNPRPVARKGTITKPAAPIKKSSSTTTLAGNSGKTSVKQSRPVSERELTDEEVEEKALEMFPNNIVSGLIDVDWKVRVSSSEQYLQTISSLDSSQIQSQVLIRLLCRKPGFKDNNFQALKIKLDCLKYISENFTITSTSMSSCLVDIITLLSDAKNGSLSAEILMTFADNLGLEFICNEMFSFAFQQKSPKVLQEAITWVSNAILEFGLDVQSKFLIDICKKALASSNSGVRAATVSLLGTMYLYMGSQLGMCFENEKSAMLTMINKEFQKRQGEKPPAPKRGKLKSKQNAVIESKEDGDYDDAAEVEFAAQDVIPRIDLATKIPASLISELSHRDWKIRMEAINKLDEIIKEAKFITEKLGELTSAIAQRLTDSNSRLATAAVSLVETIAFAMGPPCKVYIRDFLPGLWQGVGDNKNYLRAAALKCINTWANTCGCKEFFENEMIASALKSGTPALRIELWAWLSEKLPDTKGISREELLACLPHLLTNLEDRNSDVRKNANDAVLGFMIHLGYGPMVSAAEKLKPSSANAIKIILDRTRGSLPEIISPPKSAPKAKLGQRVIKNGSATITKKTNTVAQSKMANNVKASQNKKEEADTSPILKVNNLKMQRSIDESKLKVLKWNFTVPREEFIEQLKDQMVNAGVNRMLITNMFHADFKYHLKAIDILTEEFSVDSKTTTSNLDLILKWMTLRFFDTNPSVQIKGLEYLNFVFKVLAEEGYKMAEFEAAGFIPYLVIRTGDPKDTIRNTVKDIFHRITFIFPVSKIFSYIIEGLKSKNARQRSGCLDQLSILIENYGLVVCQPTPQQALKEIAKQISDRDNAVRNSALNCIVSAYFIAGDKIRQMIGQVADKDMSLLDERIKRASKARQNIPVATVKPTHIAPPQNRISVVEPLNTAAANYSDEDEMEEEDTQESEHIEDRREYNSPTRVANTTFISNNPAVQQQKKGPFELDQNVMVAIESTQIKLPTFTPVEYDMRYFQETVVPITSAIRLQNKTFSTQTIAKPRSKPSDLESWITMSSSTNLEEAVKALEEIEFFLLCDDRKKELYGLEDHLFSHLCQQLNNLSKSEEAELAKCYKIIFSIIMKVYANDTMCRTIKEQWIQETLKNLLYLLFEKRFKNMDSMFEKVVNNLVLKIISRSNHTEVTCALLKMLYDTVENKDTPSNYQNLVMKCVWKVAKYFPEWDAQLDYARILVEIHRFLTDFPPSLWKEPDSDLPSRTFKTMAHTMVKLRGLEVMMYVQNIPGVTQDSEIVNYVNKLFKHLKVIENEKQKEDMQEKVKLQQMPHEYHNQLTSIISKIGDKNETEQGLKMLYEFREQHPEINISQFLEKSSKYFQEYVRRGLEKIDIEKGSEESNENNFKSVDASGEKFSKRVAQYISEREAVVGNSNSLKVANVDEKAEYEEIETDAQDFQKRLKMLRKRAGWETYSKSSENPVTNVDQSTNFIPVISKPSPPRRPISQDFSEDRMSLEELKHKLATLKGSQY